MFPHTVIDLQSWPPVNNKKKRLKNGRDAQEGDKKAKLFGGEKYYTFGGTK